MRVPGLILVFVLFISLTAHTQMPLSPFGYTQQYAFSQHHLLNDSNSLKKNWSVSTYAGLGAGIGFYNGGNTGFFPAQIGLQINRRLTNNLYAFAGASTTPVFNFNRSFSNTGLNKNYMGNAAFGPNAFGMYQQVQAGLMYVNDDKTFSISGSIGIGSSRFPGYPANGINTQKQHFTGARQ